MITGCATGIGHAAALALAERGFRVYAGVRSQRDADALSSGGENIRPVFLDVTDAEQIRDTVNRIMLETGEAGLYGLVNNAGTVLSGPLECLPRKELSRQFEVNVIAPIMITQACLPMLRQAARYRPGAGRVVNIASVAGYTTMPFIAPYAASKHALEALSDGLRMELQPWGLHVAVIEPGKIKTPIWRKSRERGDRLAEAISAECLALYEEPLDKVRAYSRYAEEVGAPVEKVVSAISHALEANRPRTRYKVGVDARIGALVRGLPDRWQDWLKLKKLGIG